MESGNGRRACCGPLGLLGYFARGSPWPLGRMSWSQREEAGQTGAGPGSRLTCVSLCQQLADLQDSAPEKSKEQVLVSGPPSRALLSWSLTAGWEGVGMNWGS